MKGRMIVGQGAEAQIFATSLFGEKAVVKIRIEKKYRIPEMDSAIRQSRTKREAKIIYELGKLGVNAPRLLGVGKYEVYTTALKGALVKDAKEIDFEKIGTQLALMHNGNIAHGDFTPANVMKCADDYFVIDFGLSEFTLSMEERAIDLLLMKRAIPTQSYLLFEKSYAKSSKNAKQILQRLGEIEKRGRYQSRTIS